MPDYGFPKDSTRRLYEVTLKDLPEPVRFVRDGYEKPALYVCGPLEEGQDPADAPRTVPTGVRYKKGGYQIAFEFDPPLGEGEYRVVVHGSRIRAVVGGEDEPMPLVDEAGRPWSGYDLTVVEEDAEVHDRGEASPEGGDLGAGYRNLDRFNVKLDGARVESGSAGLSGEELSVTVPGERRRVELRVEPLERGGRTSHYERHLSMQTSSPEGAEGPHTYKFTSRGAIGRSAFAVFAGRRTEGRMLSRKAFGSVAVTEPPESPGAPAQLDLPVNSRLSLYVDGQRVWWGQTRLLPVLVSAERHALLGESDDHSTGTRERADLLLRIWRASLEALRFWGCHDLPTYVPETFEEYVMTRLSYGWPRSEQYMGQVYVRLGDQAFKGHVDDTLKRRLRELASALEDCELDANLFPEDSLPAGHAKLASRSGSTFYPSRKGKRLPPHLRGGAARRRRRRGLDARERGDLY